MKRVLSELQVLQLTVPNLQVVDFLLQLVEQLLSSILSFFLPLFELLNEPVQVSLDGGYQQGADPRTALNLFLCDFL
ncbi:hypothetical protein [Paraclostridium dentum]|uniref:hypothetical protein n=1 Tax=Paraclostridium dentum TaxID=2662455 RepID=UPI003F66A509